jgi:WD40 repeat protein
VEVWDVAHAAGTAAVVISVQEGCDIDSLAALPYGRLAVGTSSGLLSATGPNGFVEVWDVNAKPPVHCATIDCGSGGGLYALAVLRDGRLATRRYNNNVWIVDLDAGAVATELEGHTDEVVSLAALPDGRLASGSRDKTVRVWDVGARTCVATLTGHTDIVWTLAVLADGRPVSGAGDGTVRLWDVGAATCASVLSGLRGRLLALAALPNGRLAVGSDSGTGNSATIWLWDTRPAATSRYGTVSMLDMREFVCSIRKVVPLQDGRLACAGWPLYQNPIHGSLRVHLLEVPPPGNEPYHRS